MNLRKIKSYILYINYTGIKLMPLVVGFVKKLFLFFLDFFFAGVLSASVIINSAI